MIIFLCCVIPAHAIAPDQPEAGENFTHFMTRITRGGLFQGIKLDAPDSFQKIFYQNIRRGYWVGELDHERQRLIDAGVNFWLGWYQSETPQEILIQSYPGGQNTFTEAFLKSAPKDCLLPDKVLQQKWTDWNLCARHALMNLILNSWPDQKGTSLIANIAARYRLSSAELNQAADIFLLSNQDFTQKVRQMGYEGPIYFRGITGPDPTTPKKLWILLNDDLMREHTSFDRALLEMLEYSGIASHELNHVAQELLGRKLGLEVTVDSAEDALLIEGQAEYENERAWIEFKAQALGPTPFALFAREQAVEIIYREGNEQTGNLFPYVVGVPFVSTIVEEWRNLGNNDLDLASELEGILGKKITLQNWLFQHLSSRSIVGL